MSARRLPLAIALLFMPDSRARSRRAVMRVATLQERSGFARLPAPTRRRLLRDMPAAQRTWVAIGVALYGLARTRPFVLPLFGFALLYFASRAVALVLHAL